MREEEVKRRLKLNKLKWAEFNKWMKGQTTGIYPDGEPDFYEYDVGRFIEGELRWD